MLDSRATEAQNENSKLIGKQSTKEMLKTINSEDAKIAQAVEKCIPEISKLVDDLTVNIPRGGRLFYVGAGTSGRLGVLDASECPPTFSTPPEMIRGIIAGGDKALRNSIEGAEDIEINGQKDLEIFNLTTDDTVIGISASGNAPYVLGALKYAKSNKCTTALLMCNTPEKFSYIDHVIYALVGPEILTGSTRMKSGTATKMILNMITTSTMIKLNKTYQNIMVDLKAVNNKLWDRGARIIQYITKEGYSKSKGILISAKGNVKVALVMYKINCDYVSAIKLLEKVNGDLHQILDS